MKVFIIIGSVILLVIFALVLPVISYKFLLEDKLQTKKSYKPVILLLISIFVILFIPIVIWDIFPLRKVFNNYKNYSEFSIAVLGLHSIIQYFISKSQFETLSKTMPFVNNDNIRKSNIEFLDFKIIPPKAGSKYKYALDKKNQILEVYDFLHSGVGDNLWFPFNEWYSKNQPCNKFNQMPLWNYLSFKEKDQEEWILQLNKYIDFLKETDQIEPEK